MTDELVVDRAKLTHKQSKRLIILQMEAQRAEREMDIAAVERLLAELDEIMMSVVVSVPAGWLPDGVTLETPGWIDYLTQEQVTQITQQMQLQAPGKKTD